VEALWISPFFKSPMKDYGNDVSDYRTVDPMFGSNADFGRLTEAAHARGLKIMSTWCWLIALTSIPGSRRNFSPPFGGALSRS